MNIIREGPKHLILQCEDCEVSFNKLKEFFYYRSYFDNTIDMYDEYVKTIGSLDDTSTVLMFSKKMKSKLSFEYNDFEFIAVIDESSEDILIRLVQLKEKVKLIDLRATPRMILMRTTGDNQKYISTVNNDVAGSIINMEDTFENYGNGTIILFTDKKINGPRSLSDFNEKAIYSNIKYNELVKYLNTHRVKYINASIDNKDWSELSIKIYDSYELYDLHYNRLSMVLNELDCGLILGESWGRDAALAFLAVDVYKVRLFTYLDPLEIKKITLALEYNSNGERIVDYDLFTKRKKHDWTQVRIKGIKGRAELGMYYRDKLMSELNGNTVNKLNELEGKANE